MIIGLLETQTLPRNVCKQFGSYGDMFQNLLEATSSSFIFKRYSVDKGYLPDNIDECHGYIITGSRFNAYDNDPWIEDLRKFIREAHQIQKKCIGICFGHQVIAQALGGRTEKSIKGWGVGANEFRITHKPSWFTDTVDSFSILVSHQDQVTCLPYESSLFATSDFCHNGSFFIGDHIFTLQGHPEFTKSYLEYLITTRKTILGEAVFNKALETTAEVKLATDFSKWFYDFFVYTNHA